MTDQTAILADRLRAGETVLSAWSTIAEPILGETMGRAGYGAVTLDMQHGLHNTDSIARGIVGLTAAGVPAVVRVPVGDFAMASRAIDFGAAAVIAPMINSVEDAQRFVEFMKFPPVGGRSWGPQRAVALHGSDIGSYLADANDRTLAFGMIETREAMDALDDILAVEGIDGVFVGPSDLSIALTGAAAVDAQGEGTKQAAAAIAARARDAGRTAAIFCSSMEHATWAREAGFRFIAYGVDSALLASSSRDIVEGFLER
ncbi:MAG: hydroxyacid aldolase [Hyphomicrobiales bacterium]|nr:MAG: hydroxyacid aldolase [Hyphomicrobiales bacterium]